MVRWVNGDPPINPSHYLIFAHYPGSKSTISGITGRLMGVGHRRRAICVGLWVGVLVGLTVPKTPTYPNYMKMIILKPLILLEFGKLRET